MQAKHNDRPTGAGANADPGAPKLQPRPIARPIHTPLPSTARLKLMTLHIAKRRYTAIAAAS